MSAANSNNIVPVPGHLNIVANGHVLATVPNTDGAEFDRWCAIAYALDEDARTFDEDGENISVIEGLAEADVQRIDAWRAS